MTDRSPSELTREELEAEVLRLRAAVQRLGGKRDRTGLLALLQSWEPLDEDDDLRELLDRRREVDFVSLDEGERRDREMIARKFAGRLPADQRLSRDDANSRDPLDLPAAMTTDPTTLLLTGWRTGARKIQAAQSIRRNCDLDLAEAKSAVERCLDSETVELRCSDEEAAVTLAAELDRYGFDVRSSD